jgi:hypothetical protein
MGSDCGTLGGGTLGGCALTGGVFTRGAECVNRELARIGSVGSPGSGRSASSVVNRVAKKVVSAETTSTGVSIFRVDARRARLLESGGRFLDMRNG